MPSTIQIFSKADCPFCTRAKALLDRMKRPYSYTELNDAGDRKNLYDQLGLTDDAARTMPQVFVAGTRIGGYAELAVLAARGTL